MLDELIGLLYKTICMLIVLAVRINLLQMIFNVNEFFAKIQKLKVLEIFFYFSEVKCSHERWEYGLDAGFYPFCK